MKRVALRGLYAITSQALCTEADRLLPAVAAALRGGARLIQYRDKWNPPARRAELAAALGQLCRRQAAVFIVNDDVALAARVGADGVHLGRSDGAVATARTQLGPAAIVGTSCSGRLDLALADAAAGADYVAFGRFFPSNTKPDAPAAEPGLLARARAQLQLPICAIGGITPETAPALIAQGADLIAAVDAVFGAADIEAAARRFSRLFSEAC